MPVENPIEMMGNEEFDIEIEENPQETEIGEETLLDQMRGDGSVAILPGDDGGVDVDFDPQTQMDQEAMEHGANLADHVDEFEMARIASDLIAGYEGDTTSREEWEQGYTKGLDLLGFKYEERTEPFEGASGVTHPLLAEAVTQFQAQAYKELLPAGGPVRCDVLGLKTPEKTAQANRVKEYMNYQINHVMEEYDPETDQMLFHLPLAGSAFKKVYYDGTMERAVSKFVPVEELVVPYTATDMKSCERVTHVLHRNDNEMNQFKAMGFYRDLDIRAGSPSSDDISDKKDSITGVSPSGTEEEFTILEMHVLLDLPGFEDGGEEPTGIALPYIVSIDEASGEVLSIYRNWDEGDESRAPTQYFVHYKFLPGLGFYGHGLVHMIGGLSRSATSLLRQLIDAGTFSNLPAGFKARGIRISDDDVPLQPGEFRDMDAPGGNLREAIMPLPYKEPSSTLAQLMGFMVQAGQRFASIADMQVGEGNQNSPVGTTMAMMERGTKVMSAIHKRLHLAQKGEFKMLAKIFKDTMGQQGYPYEVKGESQIMAQDFDERVDIIPVSDPNIFSMAQRVTLAQTQLQLAQSNPQMHNVHEAFRRMYDALGVSNVDTLLPEPPKPQPVDPAQENAKALMGQPLQAFPGQNHDAHIQAHIAMMGIPVAQAVPQVMAILMGDVMAHIGFKAREKAEAEMQAQQQQPQQPQQPQMQQPQQFQEGGQVVPIQPGQPDQQMQEQMKAQMEAKVAQYTQEMIMEVMDQLTPQQQGDPLVMLRAKELEIKEKDLDRKEREFNAKQMQAQTQHEDKIDMDKERIESSEDIAQLRANIAIEKMEQANKGSQGGY